MIQALSQQLSREWELSADDTAGRLYTTVTGAILDYVPPSVLPHGVDHSFPESMPSNTPRPTPSTSRVGGLNPPPSTTQTKKDGDEKVQGKSASKGTTGNSQAENFFPSAAPAQGASVEIDEDERRLVGSGDVSLSAGQAQGGNDEPSEGASIEDSLNGLSDSILQPQDRAQGL
jgi:hypothetical protein